MKPKLAITCLLSWLALISLCSGQITVEIINVVPEAANTTVQDDDGDTPAYIELRNNNSQSSVDITGWHLSDDAANPTKWRIVGPPRPLGVPPARVIIPAGGTLRFFASGKDRVTEIGQLFVIVVYHTNFTYPCNVPYCQLSSPTGGFRDSYVDLTDRCCEGVKLVGEGSVVRYHAPTEDIGGTWKNSGFVDREWSRGVLGLGYDSPSNPFCDDLVLYFTMDEEDVDLPKVLDVSGSPNVHDGEAGDANLTNGQFEAALQLNQEGVRVAHHPELDPGAGDFSVSFWVRPSPTPAPTTEVLASKAAADGSAGWVILRTPDFIRFQLVTAVGTFILDNPRQLFTGSWAHIAVVVEGGSKFRSYVNGQQHSGKLAEGADVSSTADLFLGIDGNSENRFLGDMDEVMIWNRALADEEVISIREIGGELRLSVKDPQAGFGGTPLFLNCIKTDVEQEMRGVNSTLYVRAPFSLSQYPFGFNKMTMRVKYDDGFICYLNGGEVARRNAPVTPVWNSAAAGPRDDTLGTTEEVIDLSPFIPLLRDGGNLLAIQALNSNADAERFLIAPELCLEADRPGGGGEGCIKTTNGTDFWIAFPENFEEEPGAPLELSVVIAGGSGTTGTVELPGFPGAVGFPRNFTIPTSGIAEIVIPSDLELAGAEEIADKGVHIVANAEVSVYPRNRMDYSTDSFLGLPTACLGTEYFVLGYNTVHDNEPLLHGTQFGIVAPFDDTKVTITLNENVGSKLAGVPYDVILHRGQTYQLRNEAGKPADLTGTHIAADKPVGVFGSHRCANIASGTTFFCDFITEQLLPCKSWGTVFHVAPLRTRLGDTVRVISKEDGNLVTVLNASGTTSFTLQRGEHHTFELTEPSRISCRERSLVAQYSNSADADGVVLSDPFMVLIQPDPSWLPFYRFLAPPTSEFGGSYVTVVANASQQLNSIFLGSTAVPSLPGVIIGTFASGKVWATMPVSPGAHLMLGFNPEQGAIVNFGFTCYGFDEFDSFGFPGGMQFIDNSPPIIICPPELTLECDQFNDAGDCFVNVPDFRQDPAVVFAFDICDGLDVGISQNPQVETPLGLGDHTVIFTATDSSGNSSTCTMILHIVESWVDQFFSTAEQSDPTISGPFADPDGDGSINAIEKKNGTDPKDAEDMPLFEITFDTDFLQRQFMKIRIRRPVLPDTEIQCVLEGSREMLFWSSGPDIFEEIVAETVVLAGGQYEEVSFKALETVGAPKLARYFVRWLVTGP